jgi:hypothetical protein
MGLVKGTCYDGFPPPYDPSTANNTWIFFGSDAAYDAMAPLWGSAYKSSQGSSCGTGGSKCRDDLATMRSMGIELLRLYDWEPRNKHLRFLDAAYSQGMQILAPVSNYFLGDGFNNRETLIPALIRSFANAAGTDYHRAVAGVIFGNELAGYTLEQCMQFTKDWARIEAAQFKSFRKVRLGHPFAFILTDGARFPCFGYWNKLVPSMKAAGLQDRLFLAPQTYNDHFYLFMNAEVSGKGWVDQAWNAYKVPILFTEIGKDRMSTPMVEDVVRAQLEGVRDYAAAHPDRLLGACHFQFVDKVWMSPQSTEGTFGCFQHSRSNSCVIQYGADDFTHWDKGTTNIPLNVEILEQTLIYKAVKSVYKPS